MLVIGDSLAFHGPRREEPLTEPRLYPQVLGRELDAAVDVVARLGWTSRDAWWALTKDPHVYSVLLPRAGAVVLAVGGGDSLPASLPRWAAESIPYLRPGWLRRRVRATYHRCHPHVARLSGGRFRVVPQKVTDRYLTRCVEGVRYVRPGLPVIALAPPPYDSPYHGGVTRLHAPALAAARTWARRVGVPLVEIDDIVGPRLAAGTMNPDGMHWSWEAHALVGAALAAGIRAAWREPAAGG